nr:hypothetical protein CFP56_15199 [Quercus suber]
MRPLPLVVKPSIAAGQVHNTCRRERRYFIIPSNRADQLRSSRPWHKPTRICITAAAGYDFTLAALTTRPFFSHVEVSFFAPDVLGEEHSRNGFRIGLLADGG